MDYRREIDGLRALAVMPVLFFHAGFYSFSGGFIGVDIFFVISGYLITSLIHNEINAGVFSIANFYERRARRILPALFFVMAICLPFAWLFLPAADFFEFSQSLQAVVLFLSNHLFMDKSGYFDTAAELKPLLHTCSLAVEEQYYLIFPLLFVLFNRFLKPRGRILLFALMAIGSFIASLYLVKNLPIFNFFSLPTRVWELLLGAITAIYLKQGMCKEIDLKLAEIASILGVAGVLASIFLFDKGTPFPSVYALLPTLSTVLIIIFATPKTLLGAMLGSSPFVTVGLMSYSLYLIHQPVLVFARHYTLGVLSNSSLLGLLGFCLFLSYFTWRFIEKPFRNKEFLSRSSLYIFYALISFVFLAIGTFVTSKEGLPERFSIPAYVFNQPEPIENRNLGMGQFECSKASKNFDRIQACIVGAKDPKNKVDIAVFGDSHAERMNPILNPLGRKNNFSYLYMALGGCPPLIGVDVVKGGHPKGVCRELADKQIEYVKAMNIHKVLLVARWSLYTDLDDHDKMVSYFLVANDQDRLTRENSRLVFEQQFKKTIEIYKSLGIQVAVLLQPPQQAIAPIRFYQKLYKSNKFDERDAYISIRNESIKLSQHLALQSFNRDYFSRNADSLGFSILNPDSYLCDAEVCEFGSPRASLYSDPNHLSEYGLTKIKPPIELYILEN
jgi:peptidoglycan/LPS O-acetylase OafA/YrhL